MAPAGLCNIMFGSITENVQPLVIYMLLLAEVDELQFLHSSYMHEAGVFVKKTTAPHTF